MVHTSTVTLLGQSETNESATKMNGVVTKAQLDLPIDGLRVRDSAKVRGKGEEETSPVTIDENNNESKDHVEPEAEQGKTEKYRMWGFFRVDQPVKTLNSILIPIAHMLCLYALFNITLDTKWKTIGWGESLKKHQ